MNNKQIKLLVDVFIQNGQDNDDCLHRPGFDVDVKMFRKNKVFKKIIYQIIDYMKMILCTSFKDYGKLKGISGANIGIPLNIIAVLDEGFVEIFINPKILKVSNLKTTVSSNCGSLNLPNPIKVNRHSWIRIEWIDVESKKHKEYFTVNRVTNHNILPIAATLQHEIDHNKGILITDLRR